MYEMLVERSKLTYLDKSNQTCPGIKFRKMWEDIGVIWSISSCCWKKQHPLYGLFHTRCLFFRCPVHWLAVWRDLNWNVPIQKEILPNEFAIPWKCSPFASCMLILSPHWHNAIGILARIIWLSSDSWVRSQCSPWRYRGRCVVVM